VSIVKYISIAVLPIFVFAGCSSNNEVKQPGSEGKNNQTLAREFAIDLSGSVDSVLKNETVIQEFSDQIASDINSIDSNKALATIDSLDVLFSDMINYLETAVTFQSNSERFTDIDWDLLQTRYLSDNGLHAAHAPGSNSVHFIGTNVLGSHVVYKDLCDVYSNCYGQYVAEEITSSVTATFTVHLPSVTVADGRLTVSVSDLSISDNFMNRISAEDASLSLIIGNDPDNQPYTNLVSLLNDRFNQLGFDLVFNGSFILEDKVTLEGAGSITGEYGDDSKVYESSYSFDIAGSIINSLGDSFNANSNGHFTESYHDTWDNQSYNSHDKETADFHVDLDLTEHDHNSPSFIASLDLVIAHESESISYISEVNNTTFKGDVELAIGGHEWGLSLGSDSYVGESDFTIKDLQYPDKNVIMELHADSSYDFNRQELILGAIKVEGVSHASVILDTDNGTVVADFDNGADVTLFSADQLPDALKAY